MDERDRKHPEAAAGRLDGAYDRLPMGVVLSLIHISRAYMEKAKVG